MSMSSLCKSVLSAVLLPWMVVCAPAPAATITFGPIVESPDGAVETDKDGNPKVTTAGRDISVIAEAGAVNGSTGGSIFSAFLGLVGTAFTGNTIDALTGVGSLIDAVNSGTDSATTSVRYQLAISADKPIIKDVDFKMSGIFITERVEGVIFTDTTRAEVESASIKFGNKTATLDVMPAKDVGDSETPEARMFMGTAHIDLDVPVQALTLVFEATFNATEKGGPRDSVSAAILTGWDASISVVPLPASGLFLLGGVGGLALLRRRSRQKWAGAGVSHAKSESVKH